MDINDYLPEKGFSIQTEDEDGDTDILALCHPSKEIYALPFYCDESEAQDHAAQYQQVFGAETALTVVPVERASFLEFYNAALARNDPICSAIVYFKQGFDPVFFVHAPAFEKAEAKSRLD